MQSNFMLSVTPDFLSAPFDDCSLSADTHRDPRHKPEPVADRWPRQKSKHKLCLASQDKSYPSLPLSLLSQRPCTCPCSCPWQTVSNRFRWKIETTAPVAGRLAASHIVDRDQLRPATPPLFSPSPPPLPLAHLQITCTSWNNCLSRHFHFV